MPTPVHKSPKTKPTSAPINMFIIEHFHQQLKISISITQGFEWWLYTIWQRGLSQEWQWRVWTWSWREWNCWNSHQVYQLLQNIFDKVSTEPNWVHKKFQKNRHLRIAIRNKFINKQQTSLNKQHKIDSSCKGLGFGYYEFYQ